MNSCSPKKTRVVKPLPVQTLQLGQPPRHTNRLVPPKTETNTSYVCSAKGASRGQGNAKERTVKLLKVPPVAVDVTNTVGTAVNEGSPSALNGKELIVAEIPSSGKLVVQELPDVSFGNSELSNYYNDSNDSYHSESNDERNTSDAALTPEKNYKGNNEENINSNLLSSGGIAAEIREERGCTNSKDSDIGDGKHTGYGIAIVDGYDHRDSDSTSNGNEGIKSAVQDDLSEVSVGERASLVVNGFHAPDDDNDSKSSPNSLVCGSKSVPVSGVDIVKAYESVISSKSNSFDASANSFHADTIPMPDAVAITRNDSDDDSVGMGSYATHDDRDFGVVIADALNTPTSRSVLSYEGHQSRADNDNDMNNLSFINLEDSEVVSSVQKKARSNDMSLRYFNVTTWEATSLNPRIKTTNFKLTMDIIYRESMLLKLFDTVEMLDRKYWQYCIDRITAMENLKPLAIEPLVAQRNKIFLLQKELSVIIAHVRGVSVSLMKNLTKVRKLFAEEARTDIPVSVFWKNDNYLLKMQNDWSALYNYQSIRFWLGFSPNPFMLPPAEHDPKKVWRSHRDELLKEWQKKRKTILFAPTNSSNGRNSNSNSMGARRNAQATVRTTLLMSTIKDLSKQDETGDGGVTISFTEPDASSNFNSNSVLDKSEVKVIRPLLKKSSTVGFIESSTSSDVDKFQNLELPINSVESSKKIVFDKFSSGISSGRSSRHSSRPSSRESSRPGSARPGDTDINNSNFLPSLPFKEEQSVDTDETSEYEAEWEELRKFCWRSWDDNQLEQSAERAGQFWTNYDHKPIAVEAALGFEEVFPKNFLVPPLPTELLSKCVKYENVIMQESMRYEQTVQLQENCRTKKEEHSSMLASQSLENFGSLEFISQSILQLDQLKTRQQGSTELLTSTSKFGSSTVLPGNSWSKISNDNVFITDTTNVGEMSGSSSLIINMNSSKTRKRIEEKVSAARSAVDSASFIKKHAKPHYTSEKWYHYHAILIQALIRGFRARTRVKELRFQRNIDDAVLKLQCFFRVVKAHRILRSKLQRIKLETLVLRRKALVKYKAAIIITNYIRNAVNKQRKRNNEPLLRSKYRRRVKKRGSILCSPSIAASPELNFDSKRFLPVLTDEVSTARTVETYSSTSVDSLDEPTFEEPKIPSNTFSFFDTLAQLSSSVAVPLDPTDNQKIYFDANSLTSDYKEMSDKESTLMTAFDESQRQAEEKASAIAFVKRINEGKITIDDRNTSRLIPLKTIIVNRSYRKIKQLSRKEYTFLSLSGNSGNGVVSGSLDANNTVTSVANGRPRPTLFSTSEAYLGPIPNSTVLSRQAEAARRNLLLSRSIPDDSLVDGQEGILSHKTRHTALDRNLNDTKSIKRLLKNYY